MPAAFAWSYKRRYRSGYIWQDLRDDDLITPISDNEYVLKGSEIFPSPFDFGSNAETKRRSSATMLAEENDGSNGRGQADEEDRRRPSSPAKTSSDSSPRFGSDLSTLTDDSIKSENNLSSFHSAEAPTSCENASTKKDKGIGNINDEEKRQLSTSATSLSSPTSSPLMGKSKPGGATQMIRSLLSCGAVDTNDKVVVMINRAGKNRPQDRDRDAADISRDDSSGGSARMSGASSSDHHHQPRSSTSSRKSFDGRRGGDNRKKAAEYGGEKFSAAYRPIGGPTCS